MKIKLMMKLRKGMKKKLSKAMLPIKEKNNILIKITRNLNNFENKIKDLNGDMSLIKMDIVHLNVHYKNYNDFRKTQIYLNSKQLILFSVRMKYDLEISVFKESRRYGSPAN